MPGERISDLASVSYLADDLLSGPPNLHRSAAVSVAQGVAASSLIASTKSGMRAGVSPAHLALLATKLRTGRRSSR